MTDTSDPVPSRSGSWLRRMLGGERRVPVSTEPPADSEHPLLPAYAIEANALDQLRVADVMVPRADIVGVEVSTPLGDLARLFAEASHSRLPVYRDSLDDRWSDDRP